ncbi:hypothetical protein [Paenibacillus terreus]|uniref:hypothetical protein n=1 Tax=Paenibacillus terreus TaxID=1387834 RepID=UPI0035CCC874
MSYETMMALTPVIFLIVMIVLLSAARINSYLTPFKIYRAGVVIYLIALVCDPPGTAAGFSLEGFIFTVVLILIVFPLYVVGSIVWIFSFFQRRKSVRKNGE